jgi:copper chaperone CopZ
MEKCLVVDCEGEGKHRGLCSKHIQRYRKGNLPGIEPLPSNRGKSTKSDRLNKIRESAEKIKQLKKVKPVEKVEVEVMPGEIMLSTHFTNIANENTELAKNAARYIVDEVKKDLLGAVFEELRSKCEK